MPTTLSRRLFIVTEGEDDESMKKMLYHHRRHALLSFLLPFCVCFRWLFVTSNMMSLRGAMSIETTVI